MGKGELAKKLKYAAAWVPVMMMSAMNPVEALASSSGTGGS